MTDFITKDDVFTYLIHLGYLVYNEPTKTCRIPNNEVRQEWFNAIESLDDYSATDQIIKASEELLEQTILKNSEAVATALNNSHIHVTSNRNYNNENALAAAIYLAYIHALNHYNVYKELTTSNALAQIESKEYFHAFDFYNGKILFVGINYDKDTKNHVCEIKEVEK